MQLAFPVGEHEDGALLRNFLRAHGVSMSLLRSVKTHGGFVCNANEIRANQHVSAGDIVSFLLPPEAPTSVLAQPMPLSIVHESLHAMVLDKPAGLTIHPTLGYPNGTLANAFCGEMQQRGTPRAFRPVNRIDRNTSGLVLCAMQEYATPLLASSVQKVYYAIAQGMLPDEGEIVAPIGLCDDSFVKHCVRQDGKHSVTRYRTLWRGEGHSLAAVVPVTGRTHQIRVHLAFIGYPLAGDDFYGGSTQRIARHALHCGSVRFADVAAQYGVQASEGSCMDARACDKQLKTKQIAQENSTQVATYLTVRSPLPTDLQAFLPEKFVCIDEFYGNK